jgi:hypothetical protein
MDLNDYWQENKRFVTSVAAGLMAFWIGNMVINKSLGDAVTLISRSVSSTEADLRGISLTTADLGRAKAENAALKEAVSELEGRIAFQVRDGYALDPAGSSVSNQYFSQVSSVREELSREAGRLGVSIPDDLGLPALAPTREDELERYLEAFDLVERLVRLSFEVGVKKVDKIQIRLDPRLRSRKGLGRIEKTEIEMKFAGDSGALVRLIAASQDTSRGEVLLIDSCELVPERARPTRAVLDIKFVVARLHRDVEEES